MQPGFWHPFIKVSRPEFLQPSVPADIPWPAITFTRELVLTPKGMFGPLLHHERFIADVGQFVTAGYTTLSSEPLNVLPSGYGRISHQANYITRVTDCVTGPILTQQGVIVSVDVVAIQAGPQLGIPRAITVGVVRPSNTGDRIQLFYEVDNPTQCLIQILNNTGLFKTSYVPLSLTPPFSLALSVVGNSIQAWANSGTSWTNVLSTTAAQFVFGHTAALFNQTQSLQPSFGLWYGAQAAPIAVDYDNLRVHRFGGLSLGNPAWVTDPDGELVLFSGRPRFTATLRDGFQGSYMGVFELNTQAGQYEQIGTITLNRDNGHYPDFGGQILVDGSEYHLVVGERANLPSQPLRVRRLTTTTNITEGSQNLSGSVVLNLPNVAGSGGAYDPRVIRNDGQWHMGYTTVDPRTFVSPTIRGNWASTADFQSWYGDRVFPSTPFSGGGWMRRAGRLWYLLGGSTAQHIHLHPTGSLQATQLAAVPALPTGGTHRAEISIGGMGAEWWLLTNDDSNLMFYTAPRV